MNLFAPAAAYGGPGGLQAAGGRGARARARRGARRGLQPPGPGGQLPPRASPRGRFFTDRHHTPWGDAVNFDGPDSGPVRELRPPERPALGRTSTTSTGCGWTPPTPSWTTRPSTSCASSPTRLHGAVDRPRLRDRRGRAQRAAPGAPAGRGRPRPRRRLGRRPPPPAAPPDRRRPRGLLRLLRRHRGGGRGHAAAAGGSSRGSTPPHHGRRARHARRRGSPPQRFVHCIQNHDQVGNRALGDRLNQRRGACASTARSPRCCCSAPTRRCSGWARSGPPPPPSSTSPTTRRSWAAW